MKNLIIYYSRTGNTKKIAAELAEKLGAEIDEIVCDEYEGISGWVKGGLHVLKNKLPEISFKINPTNYDLVIMGTPIWAGTVTPLVKSYLEKNKFKNVAFFCTCGDKQTKAFKEMEKISRKPVATMELTTQDVKKGNYNQQINEFLETIRSNN